MTGPHLRQPWTATEQLIVSGVRRGLSYKEIGVELARVSGREKPLSAGTVRQYASHLVTKIEWGEEHEGYATLGPRISICTFLGLMEYVATQRDRHFRSA